MAVAQYNRKKNNSLPKRSNKHRPGCVIKGIIGMASLFIISAIAITIIVFCADWFTDTKENFEKIQYPTNHSETVKKCAQKYNVDEYLIYSVIRTESSFKENAESKVGAVGLMQIMPETFEWLLEKQSKEGLYETKDLYNADVNIEFGTYFLSILLQHFETEKSAIAAYNAGFVVDNWLDDENYSADGKNLDYIPYDETANYVKKVLSAKSKYLQIYNPST